MSTFTVKQINEAIAFLEKEIPNTTYQWLLNLYNSELIRCKLLLEDAVSPLHSIPPAPKMAHAPERPAMTTITKGSSINGRYHWSIVPQSEWFIVDIFDCNFACSDGESVKQKCHNYDEAKAYVDDYIEDDSVERSDEGDEDWYIDSHMEQMMGCD